MGGSSFLTDIAGIFSVECALFLDTTGRFFHFWKKINVNLKNSWINLRVCGFPPPRKCLVGSSGANFREGCLLSAVDADVGSPRLTGGDSECIAIVLFLYAFLLQRVGLAMPGAEHSVKDRLEPLYLFLGHKKTGLTRHCQLCTYRSCWALQAVHNPSGTVLWPSGQSGGEIRI